MCIKGWIWYVLVCVDADGVGIGSTANGFKLRVVGESRFSGSVVATAFTGDGSGLTNLSNDSLFEAVPSGIGTGISPIGTECRHRNYETS